MVSYAVHTRASRSLHDAAPAAAPVLAFLCASTSLTPLSYPLRAASVDHPAHRRGEKGRGGRCRSKHTCVKGGGKPRHNSRAAAQMAASEPKSSRGLKGRT